MRLSRFNLLQCTLMLAVILVSGCKNDSNLDSKGNPKEFKIALPISNEDLPEEVFRDMEPMRLYLERKLGVPVRYLQVNGYAPTIEALKAKKIHMANLSPFPYILAREKAGVSALFCLGKNNGLPTGEYRTAIVSQKSSNIKTMDDLKSKSKDLTIAFVDPASTSGHIVPYNYLKQLGIDPDNDFKKVVFANNVLAAILTLASGKVDIACAQTAAFSRIYKMNKNVSPGDFNFLWVSEPIPPTAYCIRNDINPEFRKKVMDAYFNVKSDTAAWGSIKRRRASTTGSSIPADSLNYVPVYDSMYEGFAKMVKNTKGLKIE
jgi:phosphonate transport system substrate-binding protein